jgi:hypothetical protein
METTADGAGTEAERFAGAEAVLKLQREFRGMARAMATENLSLVDDLAQEMSLGVLLCKGKQTLSYFRERGVLRAIDFLRAEERHRCGQYSDLKEEPIYESRNFLYVPRQVEKFRERAEAKRTRLERLEDYAREQRMRRASA